MCQRPQQVNVRAGVTPRLMTPAQGCQTPITRLTHQVQGLKENSSELKQKVIKAFQWALNWEGDPWPRPLGLPSMLCSPAMPTDPPRKLFLKLKGNFPGCKPSILIC